MKTFLLPREPVDNLIDLHDKDFHYLCHVRRFKEGASLRVKTPSGAFWNSRFCEVTETTCRLELIEPIKSDVEERREIFLYFSLPKGKKTDRIIRQATESEVTRIQPLTSAHSLVKIRDEKDLLQKHQRWQKIVREALQQSGSPVATEVFPVKSLKSLTDLDQSDVFFLHQTERSEPLLFKKVSLESSRSIALIIGPEGGFSKEEVLWMEEQGFMAVFLGNTVLRAETAAIFAVAAVRTILGEF